MIRTTLLTVVIGLFFPAISFAAGGLVPCDGPECNLCTLVGLFHNILNFLIGASFILATIMFAYAGFEMLIHADNAGAVSKARGIFTDVLIGFIFILSSWLIIDSVMRVLFTGEQFQGAAGFGKPWSEILCAYQSNMPEAEVATTTPQTTGVTSGVTAGGAQGRTLGNITELEIIALRNSEDPTILNPGAFNADSINAEIADFQAQGLPPAEAQQEAFARALLLSRNITINNGPCASAGATGCTDLRFVNRSTLDTAMLTRQQCATCDLVVTGGSELTGGHGGTAQGFCTLGGASHCNGFKVDMRANNGLDTFVQHTFTQIANRTSDGALQYRNNATGAIWAREDDHWDILVPPLRP